MRTTLIAIAAGIAALTAVQASAADGLVHERNIGLGLATDAATAVLAACQAKGFPVVVTVVDSTGLAKVVMRADGAMRLSVDVSAGKARASVAFGMKSSDVARMAMKGGEMTAIYHLANMTIAGGAVPIMAGKDLVGAIGVSGAPGSTIDEDCALTGLKKIEGKLK